MARRFGSQCIVLSVDARTVPEGSAPTPSGWEVTTHGGRRGTGIDAVEWAARGQELGAGEILLNSMDADGTRAGFDLKMIAAVRAAVDVPVIASGGAGAVDHFAPAVRAGADAVLAASVFHFGTFRIGEVKAALRARRGGGAVNRLVSLDPAIAARLKRTPDGLVLRDRPATWHRRGADGRLDGRRGAASHADHRAGHLLVAFPPAVLGEGGELRARPAGARGPTWTATATPCW